MKRLCVCIIALTALLINYHDTAAEPHRPDAETKNEEQDDRLDFEDIDSEIAHIASELELEEWQHSFEASPVYDSFKYKNVDEMLVHYAQEGANGNPESIWHLVLSLIKQTLAGSMIKTAVLTASALITGIAANALKKEGGKLVVMVLGLVTALAAASVLSSLCSEAYGCIEKTAGFCEAAIPIMTALMTAAGAVSSAGALRPLMIFISSALVIFLKRVILPLIISGAAVCLADGVCGEGKLAELNKLIVRSVKWLIGIAAVVYFGICALQGLTVSALDGIAVRTAKYAADKLLPSAGGFIGGTADTVLGCAVLVKNGAGVTAVIIMAGLIIKPLLTIGSGALAFKLSAAVSGPAADPSAVKLLSDSGEIASCLFGASAIAGVMFMLTVLVFIASGGVSAGSW